MRVRENARAAIASAALDDHHQSEPGPVAGDHRHLRRAWVSPRSSCGRSPHTASRSRRKSHAAYDVDRWLEFYEAGLDYILELNAQGVDFAERVRVDHAEEDADQRRPRLRRSDLARRDRHRRARLQLRRRRLRLRRRPDARRDGRHDLPARQRPQQIPTRRSCSPTRYSDPLEESFALSAPMCTDCAIRAVLRRRSRLPPRDDRATIVGRKPLSALLPAQHERSPSFCSTATRATPTLAAVFLTLGGTMIPLRGRATWSVRRDPLCTGRSGCSSMHGTLTVAAPRLAPILLDPDEPSPRRFRALHLGRPRRAPTRRPSICVDSRTELDYLNARRRHLSQLDGGSQSASSGGSTARQNSILLTERCDHYCLMCSQPPKTADDDQLPRGGLRTRPAPATNHTRHRRSPAANRRSTGNRLIELLRLCRNRSARRRPSTCSPTGAASPIPTSPAAGPRSTTRT